MGTCNIETVGVLRLVLDELRVWNVVMRLTEWRLERALYILLQ